MHVLNGDDHRSPAATPEAQLSQQLHRSSLHRLGTERGPRLALLLEAKKVEHVRHPLSCIQRQLLEARPDLVADQLRRVDVANVEHAPDDVEDRKVWDGAPVRETATVEIRYPTWPQALPKLVEQAGLADPRLSHDAYDMPSPAFRLLQQPPQRAEVLLPPHERAEPPAPCLECESLRPRHTVGRTRQSRDDSEPLQVEPPTKKLRRGIVSENGIGLRALKEPVQPGLDFLPLRRIHSGKVDTLGDQTAAGVDRESRFHGGQEVGSLAFERLQHCEGGVGGATRRTLDRLEPEECHHADRRQVVHVSAETPELPDELVLSRRQLEGG